jgi:hypothetical protein
MASPNRATTTSRNASREVAHLTVDERVARGKAARVAVPRSSHAEFEPAPRRPDHGQRPGANAAVGAHGAVLRRCAPVQLRRVCLTGAETGVDLNDFDETLPGPWEWDVKHLTVSMLIAGRDDDFSVKEQDQIVLDTVEGRQLKDWKGSAEIEQVIPTGMAQYGRPCGWTRACAQRRPHRDRRLPRQRLELRPGDRRVLPSLCRAERARLPGACERGEGRQDRRRGGPLS